LGLLLCDHTLYSLFEIVQCEEPVLEEIREEAALPEPEESASYKSQEGTLNEEPVSNHPGVQIDSGA